MKGLGWFDKLVFIINSLVAFALLLSYLLPFIPPKDFPLLSVLSLGVPILIITNFMFFIFWLLRFKRQMLLPLFVLLLGYNYVGKFVRISSENDNSPNSQLSVMSYNVRMFNAYKWVDDDNIPEKITNFVTDKDPDILATQEHYIGVTKFKEIYPYSYVYAKDKNSEFGSAIFSKFPIINKKSLDFPHDGNNNAIYVDILIDSDTLRIYNIHLQSLNIKPEIQDLRNEDSKKLIGRIGYGFGLQQEQEESLMNDVENSPYKTLILGDFNNTSFSYVYKNIRGDRFKDAFIEAGKGFGQTFDLSYFPLRIDFLMIDQSIEVQSFERFKPDDLSDHFPIMSNLSW